MPVLKPDIIAELEHHRDDELSDRKAKRKKQAEEEAAKKDKQHLENPKNFVSGN